MGGGRGEAGLGACPARHLPMTSGGLGGGDTKDDGAAGLGVTQGHSADEETSSNMLREVRVNETMQGEEKGP